MRLAVNFVIFSVDLVFWHCSLKYFKSSHIRSIWDSYKLKIYHMKDNMLTMCVEDKCAGICDASQCWIVILLWRWCKLQWWDWILSERCLLRRLIVCLICTWCYCHVATFLSQISLYPLWDLSFSFLLFQQVRNFSATNSVFQRFLTLLKVYID